MFFNNIWCPSEDELKILNRATTWHANPFAEVTAAPPWKIVVNPGLNYKPQEDLELIYEDFRNNGNEVHHEEISPSPIMLHDISLALFYLEEIADTCLRRCSQPVSSPPDSSPLVDQNNNEVTQSKPVLNSHRGPPKKQPWHKSHVASTKSQGVKCAFCTKNGEEFKDHLLKDENGRIVCPVLRKFKCKLCGAQGANAHTQKFCPLNPMTKGNPVAAGMPPGLLPANMTFKKPIF